ncbi:MAG: orotate phosphoribosyltransferase [Aeriscardovia sp.]|nr:orotate phosphoribosyltransferase [Aeriscardovia sp.]MBO7717355.1 orotate phosphoribosyltransferase [Aeriscardovia sp.]
MADWDESMPILRAMLKEEVGSNPFSDLFGVTMSAQGGILCGRAVLGALERRGIDLSKIGAVGALSPAGVPLAMCCLEAGKERGLRIDAFSMDFVYPSLKGPSVQGRDVVLVDAWISDLGYIQTSSLITLTERQELELDWSIVRESGAHILAVSSLMAGSGEVEIPSELELKDVNTGSAETVPFAYAFSKKDIEA